MTASGGVERRGDLAVARVAARAGLVGNPSDGFGGAVLATPVPGMHAEVRATAAAHVRIGAETWATRDSWEAHVAAHGHGDEGRIISAASWILARHLGAPGGMQISWSSTIPRSVGLAGSSALAVATIDAVASAWGAVLDRRVVAALALAAEVDVLGIAAGWQDRIVQAFGCTVLVDASATEVVDGVSVPAVDIVRPSQPVRLVVGWSPASMSESGGYHQALRRAPDTHGTAMRDLAALARRAADAVHGGDVDGLAAALDDGWRVRQAVAPLRDDHAALVDAVRALGVAATTPGSGGAVVAITRSDDDTAAVVDALSAAGCPSAAWLMR